MIKPKWPTSTQLILLLFRIFFSFPFYAVMIPRSSLFNRIRAKRVSGKRLTYQSIKVIRMIKFRTKNILRDILGDGNLLPCLPRRLDRFLLRERLVVPAIFTIPMHSIQLLTAINWILNIRKDLISACSSSIVVLSFLCMLGIYWHYCINRDRFYALFNDVEDTIHGSVCERPKVIVHFVNLLLIRSVHCRDGVGSEPGNLHENGTKRWTWFELGFACFYRNFRYASESIHISGISLVSGRL